MGGLNSNRRMPSSRSFASMPTGLTFSPRPVAIQAPSNTKPGQSEPNRDEISLSSAKGKGDNLNKLRALRVATASELPPPRPAIEGILFFMVIRTPVSSPVACRHSSTARQAKFLSPSKSLFSSQTQEISPFASVRSKVTRSQRSIYAIKVISS